MMVNKKLQVWLPLIFSLILIAGMYLGYGLSGKNDFFKTDRPNTLQEAVEIIKRNYVDKVSLDSLQGDAIQEMMTHLDPHSVYFPPVDLKEATEELEGKFDGIGVEFNVFSDTVNILYVVPEGPSEKAGLQIGDRIIRVDQQLIAGKPLPTDSIKKLIKGEKGSTVKLQIFRNGKALDFTITRGTVPVPSVDAAYMIDSTTGYIKLAKFTFSSYEEFMKSLEDLQKQGLKRLIYDLRGNGGGYMDEAIEMADEFLSGDKLIVFTEGENKPRVEKRAKRPGLFEEGELVILVDEFTASASEVLAGSLQDWDRATIIGRRTFGKGLVQQNFELPDGSALRLTIARYYTPLGRSIQRPYDKGKKDYMDEVWQRYSNGQSLYADSNKVDNGRKFTTPAGKIVFGGGGIMPTVFVPIDTLGYPSSINRLLFDGSFSRFVYQYYLNHRANLDQFTSPGDFARRFTGGDELWNQFLIWGAKDSVNVVAVTAGQKVSLRERLKASLARYKWRNAGFYQVLNQDDPMVEAALEAFNKR